MPTDTFTMQSLYVRLREYGERGRKLQEPEDQDVCYETLLCLLYMTGKLCKLSTTNSPKQDLHSNNTSWHTNRWETSQAPPLNEEL